MSGACSHMEKIKGLQKDGFKFKIFRYRDRGLCLMALTA